MNEVTMRRSPHAGRQSLGSEVAPHSDQSSPHIHHSPKPFRFADHKNQIASTRYSFAALSHEDGSLSLVETGPESLMGVSDATPNVRDKALHSLSGLQYKPWEFPEPAWRSRVDWSNLSDTIPYNSEECQPGLWGRVVNFRIWAAAWIIGSQDGDSSFDGINDVRFSYRAWSEPERGGEDHRRFEQFVSLSTRTWTEIVGMNKRISWSMSTSSHPVVDTTGGFLKDGHAGVSMPILLNSANGHLKGRKALVAWKEGAGLSKTWRRCNRVTMSDSRVLVILRYSDQPFYRSPLWLPQAFIRSPMRQRHNDKKRTLISAGRARRLDKHFEPPLLSLEEDEQSYGPRQSQLGLARIQERGPADLGNTELPAAYMRLMWGNGSTLNGQLDRFLPEGLILQSHWRVSSFLRNHSHADVYVITDINHLHGPGPELELHSFLTGLSGNSATYAKRKQERMYKSDQCLARFWYGERRVLVVRVPKPVIPYRLQMEDYPKLKGIVSRTRTQFRYPHWLSSIPTYAEVLGTTNHDPQSPPLNQKMKEEEVRILEKISEKVREKKSKKQRDKRRKERLVRKLAQQVPV